METTEKTVPQTSDLDVSGDLAGTYLKKSDVEDAPLTFTIQSVERVLFEAKAGRPAQQRVVLTFVGDPLRRMSLNKTNLGICAKAWGKHTAAWIGRPVTVELDEGVTFAGQLVGGLRVKIRKPAPLSVVPGPATIDSVDPELGF
jgi:hypothetical protein